MPTRFTFTAVTLLLSPALSVQAEHKVPADDDLFFDIPVVLSASNLEQPITETPIAVTSIDRQQIEASGARSIPDILRIVPGIQVGYSLNEFGDEPRVVVTYHGHSDQYSRQLQVLIDGRSIYEPMLGGVNWNTIPVNIDDIERIEVMRGPNASTFGSNSFLAVINIITRHAAEDAGQYIRVNAGNHHIADATYRFADRAGDMDYRVTVTGHNDDGADGVSSDDVDDDINSNAIDYRIDYQVDSDNHLTYQGGYSDSTQQARGGTRMDSFTTARDVENISAYQFFRIESSINPKNQLKTQYYYNLFDKTDRYTAPVSLPAVPLDDDLITFLNTLLPPAQQLPPTPTTAGSLSIDTFDFGADESFKSERHNLEITHYYEPDASNRLIWGAGLQKDIGTSAYYFGQPSRVSRDITRVFGNIESQLSESINLNLGLLWEDSDLVGGNVSPRAALIGKLDDKHTVRASYSEAIRTLFLVEQYSDIVLTQDVTGTVDVTSPVTTNFPFSVSLVADVLRSLYPLQAEHIIAREIGYYGKFRDDRLRISARAFRNSIGNLIDQTRIPSAIQLFPGSSPTVDVFDNLYATTVKGAELEFDYQASDDTRLIASTALLNIEGRYNPADISANLTAASLWERTLEYHHSAPDKAFNLMLIRQFDSDYSGSLSFYYVGDMAWLDASRNQDYAGERNTGGYRKLDLRLARSWNTGSRDITLALNLQNLLGDYNDYDAKPVLSNSRYEKNFTGYIELRISHH